MSRVRPTCKPEEGQEAHSRFHAQEKAVPPERRGPFCVGSVIREHPRVAPFSGIGKDDFAMEWASEAELGDIYLPRFCALLRRLRRDLEQEPFSDFAEMAFPRMLTHQTAARFGLIGSWPYILLSVQALCAGDAARALPSQAPPPLLDPVQCAPFYAWMHGRTVAAEDLPMRVRESLGGWSYRNERASSLECVRKSLMFLRDEYIYVGTAGQVKSVRRRLVEAFSTFLGARDLQHRLVVGAGCFEAEPNELANRLESITDPWDVPVLDVELFIPGDGTWLEVLGASLWGTKLTNAFDIRGEQGELESGCTGIGVSRLGYALLSQAGDTCP